MTVVLAPNRHAGMYYVGGSHWKDEHCFPGQRSKEEYLVFKSNIF